MQLRILLIGCFIAIPACSVGALPQQDDAPEAVAPDAIVESSCTSPAIAVHEIYADAGPGPSFDVKLGCPLAKREPTTTPQRALGFTVTERGSSYPYPLEKLELTASTVQGSCQYELRGFATTVLTAPVAGRCVGRLIIADRESGARVEITHTIDIVEAPAPVPEQTLGDEECHARGLVLNGRRTECIADDLRLDVTLHRSRIEAITDQDIAWVSLDGPSVSSGAGALEATVTSADPACVFRLDRTFEPSAASARYDLLLRAARGTTSCTATVTGRRASTGATVVKSVDVPITRETLDASCLGDGYCNQYVGTRQSAELARGGCELGGGTFTLGGQCPAGEVIGRCTTVPDSNGGYVETRYYGTGSAAGDAAKAASFRSTCEQGGHRWST